MVSDLSEGDEHDQDNRNGSAESNDTRGQKVAWPATNVGM
jgi:hypothetical protein